MRNDAWFKPYARYCRFYSLLSVYQPVKSQLLRLKGVFKHQDLQMFGRVSETQLQVGEKIH